jgi:hypothetical protein
MPSRYQEMLRNQRQNEETARAGLSWEDGEEDKLVNMILKGDDYTNVARDLKRTEGSVKNRLYSIICRQIDLGDETYLSAYDKFKVSTEELEDFREKKKKRDEKLQQRQKTNRPRSSRSSPNDTPLGSNNIMAHIIDIKRDLASIKQYFKIH